MTDTNVYLNGRILPADEAVVSAADAGLQHGASTFTTMLAHHGRVFRLDRHLTRLLETAGILGLYTEATPETLTAGVYELLQANELSEARMRITLTPGPVNLLSAGDRPAQPTTLITAQPLPDYPAEWYTEGITAVVSSFRQVGGDPTFGFKTGCYFPRILARQEAAAKGADEALWYTTDHHLAEACFCNVFLVADGAVRTPPRDTPVLPGVVRGAVLELCEKLKISCDADTPLTVQDMLAAQEMFLTSSTMGIRPIVRVERHVVGDGTPGALTKKLSAEYRDLLETECAGRE